MTYYNIFITAAFLTMLAANLVLRKQRKEARARIEMLEKEFEKRLCPTTNR